MIPYIKFIKLYLFIIISIFFCNTSFAHEIKPSIADFTYDQSYLNFEVRLNAELILSNIDASNISNTNSSPLTEIYDRYRLLNKKDLENSILESWKDISSNIDIKINNKLKEIDLIKIDTQDVKNFEISRDTLISFRVLLNEESENFTFKWIKIMVPSY